MSCQIKDYQEAPLKLSSVVPLNVPPSAVCKTVREMTTRKVQGKGEEERDKWMAKKPDNYKQRVRRK